MLPPLLTHDITNGLRQFLTSAYAPSNPHFQGLMKRFVQDESLWLRGPFVQLGLPFRSGMGGVNFFPSVALDYPGYHHQEAAWRRLSTSHAAANTLVATGTGSGKTECFLYPLLMHAAQQQALGGEAAKGIKALVIYPMNALATDQARRFAEEVAKQPAFASLRVGLFVGGGKTSHGGNATMSAAEVITDREAMRRNPPDILLTNYKMLDYLLIRPKDRQLWAHNLPTTLRYVVIDELHSFDGAQGTDLALLLRRLQARLKVPKDHLIFAGTSATLGSAQDTSGLREYARQITGAAFDPESVITENRLSVAEFLGEATIEHVFQAQDDLSERLDPARYASQEQAVTAWHGVFFPDLDALIDVTSTAARGQLGQLLKTHLLTHNLLKLSKGSTISLEQLVEGIQGPLPVKMRPHALAIVNALLTLLAWARNPASPTQPLLTLREQVWVRELRRMVARVYHDGEQVNLVPAADLAARPNGIHLPLIQCSNCRLTGWLTVQRNTTGKVSLLLDEIYNNWFSGTPEITRLYPLSEALKRPAVDGVTRLICGECGNLQAQGANCNSCGFGDLIDVFQPTKIKQTTYHDAIFTRHDDTCPSCAMDRRQLLIGARNTTLGAQVIERSWASAFNDDKKLIAFSDSVQDAAHRSGFFAARTYRNLIRYSLSQYLTQHTPASAQELLQKLPEFWFNTLGRDAFVATFIGPNMMWLSEWEKLQREDLTLASNSRLPERVRNRLAWEVFSEMSYHSARGRTLESLGMVTLSPRLSEIDALLPELSDKLSNELGMQGLSSESLRQWVWGFLHQLKSRGAIAAFAFLHDFGDAANFFKLAKLEGRNEWMPNLGSHQLSWLSLGSHRYFDKISQGDSNWYHNWLLVTLGHNRLLPSGITKPSYELLCRVLSERGVLVSAGNEQYGDSYAIRPEALAVSKDACRVASSAGVHAITMPREWFDALSGMPSPVAMSESLTQMLEPRLDDIRFMQSADVCRVIGAEHTGLLQREDREALERRFKAKPAEAQPWYENLLSATPTLEMGVDIGSLSSVMLCSVPPNQASFLQRIGRAGRRDGNSVATTLADGGSPHDLYFFEEVDEMLSGDVSPPGIFLKAAEVLRRQLFAFCLDAWVGSGIHDKALPEKTKDALDAVQTIDEQAFPHTLLHFMRDNEVTLLEQFISLLGDDADDRVKARLQEFMTGSEDQHRLSWQLLDTLEALVKERKVHKQRAEQLKVAIAKEKAKPADEARDEAIDQFERQRALAIAQSRDINESDLLNTLTDAGLIPNYAFPEVGIQLKSLLWRKKALDEIAEGKYVTLPKMTFERPASSALSEFAPENKFYANQRRVEINQIDMKLATLEQWRLCPSCHHMENLTLKPDEHGTCPRCNDAMWANVSQKQTLLRFKQAIANAEDAEARIDDRQEDREPKFYERQLLVDFTPDQVSCAWKLNSQTLPFGFEFINKAYFRDINFGEKGKSTQLSKVAGREANRPGFLLCGECGMVQIPKRRQLKPGETAQSHSFDCSKRLLDSEKNLIDCLYLYREFSSEALRILMPFTKAGVDDKAMQSFMAAIQLGLKKRFGGKVDHLRMTSYSEPCDGESADNFFVMLYDSVPGGTGYLHQLLSEEAQTLGEVFELALKQLNECSCHANPEKDGCYRCVFQYRLGRAMAQTSRDTARDILTELLGEFQHLEPTANLRGIKSGAHADSTLEARLFKAMVQLGKEKDMPNTRLLGDIVNGKSGYQLQVGDELYWVEPQVNLGLEDGFPIGSKPDFVIWPRLTTSPRRPIAIFTDGWTYHQHSLEADALKRTGIIRSGKFWVWSITWEDVQLALDGNPHSDIGSPFGSHTRHSKLPAAFGLSPELELFKLHSIGLLMNWLASPAKTHDAFLQRLQKTALCLSLQCFGKTPLELAPEVQPWLQRLPESVRLRPEDHGGYAISAPALNPTFALEIPKAWLATKSADVAGPNMLLLNDTNASDEKELHLAWRKWLSWSNHLQVLPGFWLLTHKTLNTASLDDWVAPGKGSVSVPFSGDDAAWQQVMNSAVKSVQTGLQRLQAAHMPIPDEMGYELPDEQGDAIAEAELVWQEQALVVLTDGQAEFEAIWQAQGYTVVLAATDDWPEQIMAHLQAASPNTDKD